MRIWQAGADGVYTFNIPWAEHPMYKEIGDPERLASLSSQYAYESGPADAIDGFVRNGSHFLIAPDSDD